MTIPEIGADPQELVDFIDALVTESSTDSRRAAWEGGAQRCMDLYIGNHWDTPTPSADNSRPGDAAYPRDGSPQSRLIKIVYNRVQNAVISLLAVQTSDPPKITFTPRETGEPALCYLNAELPEAAPFLAMMSGVMVQTPGDPIARPWTPDDPLPPEYATLIKQQIDVAKYMAAQAVAAGQPAVAPPPDNLYIEVNDLTTSEALQTIFDALWEQADGQFVFCENVLNKNILGWQPTLYEFDQDRKVPVLTNVEQEQVFPDPVKSSVRRGGYLVYVEKISADEAAAKYPAHEAVIRANATEGGVRGASDATNADHLDQNFKRDFVTIRTAWIANQVYPDSPDKAMTAGKVTTQMVEDGEPQMTTDPATGTTVLVPPPTRQAFVLPDNTETAPAAENWPRHLGIRQVRVIHEAGIVLSDDESPFGETIPTPINVNTPIPFSPYGQGEPVRLDGMQRALNHVISSIVTHNRYNAYPPELRPQAVANALGPEMKKSRSQPGQTYNIPDWLVQMVGGDLSKLIHTLDIPNAAPDAWKLVQFLADAIDKEANQADVMQGNASSTWSGEAINSLQNAANQLIRAKSQRTEFWLKDVARLIYHSILHHLTPDDWKRYCSKYPVQAIQSLYTRAKAIDIDISVQVTSGSGATRQAETQQLIAARKSGIPVSDPEIMQRIGIDPESQMQEQASFLKKQAELLPQMQAQQQEKDEKQKQPK